MLLATSLIVVAFPFVQVVIETNDALSVEKQHYKSIIGSCAKSNDEAKLRTIGEARSQDRLDAINQYFAVLVAAPCVRDAAGIVYNNPIEGVKLNTLDALRSSGIDATTVNGALYDLDYGLATFQANGTTLCDDGWISGSSGQGTCSHHGGYARGRGSQINYADFGVLSNPFLSDNSTSIFRIFTTPISILWNAIFHHLLNNPKGIIWVGAFSFFILIISWPLVLFIFFAIHLDKESKLKNDFASEVETVQDSPPLPETGGFEPDLPQEQQPIPRRPRKPRTVKPIVELENYNLLAWLNEFEVKAASRSVSTKKESDIFSKENEIVGKVIFREGISGNQEIGIQRRRGEKSIIIGWFSYEKILLAAKSISERMDLASDGRPDGINFKVVFIEADGQDGIAGVESVRIYRAK